MVPNKSQFCLQVPNFISKDVEKSRFRFRSRDFCQVFEGFGFGFEKFGLRKKVSVSVSEKFGLGKKVSVSVSEKLVSEKSLDFGSGEFGLRKKVSVSENLVSENKSRYRFRSKFLYSSFSDGSVTLWELGTKKRSQRCKFT